MNVEAQHFIKRWSTMGERTAMESKIYFIRNLFEPDLVDSDYWGEACVELLESFHDFIERVSWDKSKIRVEQIPFAEKLERLKALASHGRLEENYDTLDAIFKKALNALQTEEPEIEARLAAAKDPSPLNPVDAPPPRQGADTIFPSSVVLPTPVPPRAAKRRLQRVEDVDPAGPPPKRRSTRITRKVVPFVNWK